MYVARERLEGYRRGLEDAGIALDERLVVHTSFDREGGAAGVDRLMAGEAPFTAISCANDPLALGALGRLAEAGIEVPRDVSVAGFDDIPVAAMTAPRLSTVRLPLREMGRRGFACAVRSIAGEAVGEELLPTELVMRDSTAARPAPTRARAGARRGSRARAGLS
jgi:LacI family transcriptional regulator